jgi:hypothetical protein
VHTCKQLACPAARVIRAAAARTATKVLPCQHQQPTPRPLVLTTADPVKDGQVVAANGPAAELLATLRHIAAPYAALVVLQRQHAVPEHARSAWRNVGVGSALSVARGAYLRKHRYCTLR